MHAEALHYRPACAVDDGEALVRKRLMDLGGDFKVGERGQFHTGSSLADGVDQNLGRSLAQSASSSSTMSFFFVFFFLTIEQPDRYSVAEILHESAGL